eukprot:TRINITY_DN27346_c0_g1_i1.p1 TRINITY_DN27346_c0_g1~~TRINITY_DN27346_c0_g1_i1.p1  ORF type:complete len:268 (+),score=133.79 TRINITY_DN27346_c0_g1_i1:61-804(+)
MADATRSPEQAALEATKEPEAAAQRPRENLLDVVLNKLAVDVDNGVIYSRVVMAGGLTSQESSRGFFEAMMGDHANDYTGILVETTKNFVHLIEGQPHLVQRYVAAVAAKVDEYDTAKDVVIAAYTDDIGQRSFSKWTFVEQGQQGNCKVQKREKLKVMIVDVTNALCELGGLIYHKEKLQMMQFLSALKTTHPDILPTSSQIEVIYSKPGIEYCLTLDEFTELFCKPVDLKLHGELIWPPQPPLEY